MLNFIFTLNVFIVSSNFGRSSLNRINSEDTRDINQNTEAYAEKTQSTEQITEIGNTSEGDQKEYYARESSLEEYQVYPSSIQQSEDPLHPFTPVTNKNLCYPVVEGTQLSFLKKDAFLSFWTLAKLALKPLRNDSEDETDKFVKFLFRTYTMFTSGFIRRIIKGVCLVIIFI